MADLIIQIDATTAVIFFAIGFVTGAAVALWNVATKYAANSGRRWRE